jgi:hypothetical protein
MDPNDKAVLVLGVVSAMFLTLHSAFLKNSWGRREPLPEIALVDPKFTNVTTARLSTAELRSKGEDTSGVECYACHERNKTPTLHRGTNGTLLLPKEHSDLVMAHGRNNRNNICFNCHSSTNLESLVTRDGSNLTIEQSTLLCGSCHGPTYRDWELGVHGRLNGYWNTNLGSVFRKDCVSCHDPHNPAFPSFNPAPGPNPLRARRTLETSLRHNE